MWTYDYQQITEHTRTPERVNSPIEPGIRYNRVVIVDLAGILICWAPIHVTSESPCNTSSWSTTTLEGNGFCSVISIRTGSPLTQISLFFFCLFLEKDGMNMKVLSPWRVRLYGKIIQLLLMNHTSLINTPTWCRENSNRQRCHALFIDIWNNSYMIIFNTNTNIMKFTKKTLHCWCLTLFMKVMMHTYWILGITVTAKKKENVFDT